MAIRFIADRRAPKGADGAFGIGLTASNELEFRKTISGVDTTKVPVLTTGAQTVAGVKTFSSAPVMSGASITAGTVPVAAFVGGAGLNALSAAGLGTSAAYVKTDTGTKTLLVANATKDRGVLVVVQITEAFATGTGTQPTLAIGETSTVAKGAATTVFAGATLGQIFVFGFLNTSTKAILATLTAAVGDATGGATITVITLPNS